MILLAALRFLIPDELQRLNGLKNATVVVANGVAALLFVIVAHIAWDAAALVAAGSTAGAYLGARHGRKIPTKSCAGRWSPSASWRRPSCSSVELDQLCPTGESDHLEPGRGAELLEQTPDVALDRRFGDQQLLGDSPVAGTFAQ